VATVGSPGGKGGESGGEWRASVGSGSLGSVSVVQSGELAYSSRGRVGAGVGEEVLVLVKCPA